MLKPMKTVIAVGAVLAITGSIMVGTVVATTRSAIVTADGKSTTLHMLQTGDTETILKSAGLTVTAKDLVERSTAENGDILLNIRSGRVVGVSDGNSFSSIVLYNGDTVADAIKKAGLPPVEELDLVTPALTEKVTPETTVHVERRHKVTVTADGETKEMVVSKSATAVEALNEAGLKLGEHDTLNVPADAPLASGAEVTVTRVEFKDETVNEPVDFETVKKEDSSMAVGTSKVETAGVKGERKIVKRSKYVDGKLDFTEQVSSEVTKKPVSEVVIIGTKPAAVIEERPGGTGDSAQANGTIAGLSYSKVMSGICTAYSGGGITSTGVPAQVGRVAVDPSIIPYGTKMYIASADGSYVYGYAVAADTGGFIEWGSVLMDLYMDTEQECISFGRKTMNIYILN